MRKYHCYVALCILIAALFVTGCASAPETKNGNGQPASTAQAEQKPVDAQPAAEPADSAAEEPVAKDNETYEMGEEEYQETKRDLSKLVEELNQIIANRNYQKWLTYLTTEYKEYYSDPAVLQEYSDAPLMKKYNIKLRSLKDYFNYVVVASRKDVRIDDIKALSENKVRAYMIVNNEPIVVYTLEKVGGQWKITK